MGTWVAHLFCYRRRARGTAAGLLQKPLDPEAVSLLGAFNDL